MNPHRRRLQWTYPIVVLVTFSLLVFAGFYTIDYFITGGADKDSTARSAVTGTSKQTIGEAAGEAKDEELVTLVFRFMNSYMRAALNARDVRTAYNVLNQYRLLVEAMLRRRTFLGDHRSQAQLRIHAAQSARGDVLRLAEDRACRTQSEEDDRRLIKKPSNRYGDIYILSTRCRSIVDDLLVVSQGPYRTNAAPAARTRIDFFPALALVSFASVMCMCWFQWADRPFGLELTLASATVLLLPYVTAFRVL